MAASGIRLYDVSRFSATARLAPAPIPLRVSTSPSRRILSSKRYAPHSPAAKTAQPANAATAKLTSIRTVTAAESTRPCTTATATKAIATNATAIKQRKTKLVI